MTVNQLFQLTQTCFWNKPRYLESRWAKEVQKYWTKHIEPAFGHVAASELHFSTIRNWHRNLEQTPYTANRCLEVLSRIYSYGIEEGLLQNNPCRGIKAFTEKKRRRYAKEEELVSLGKILLAKMTTHPLQVAFVLLVALTGARPWSLFRLRRQDLYRRGNAGVLYFRGKSSEDSGEDESLILPEFLLELIEKLPVRDDGLLLGEVKYRAFWDLVRKKIGCNDLRLRDLRRTFGSMGLSDGVSLNLIGELLNHKSLQTTMNYAKLFDSVRVQASLRISNRIGLLLGVHE